MILYPSFIHFKHPFTSPYIYQKDFDYLSKFLSVITVLIGQLLSLEQPQICHIEKSHIIFPCEKWENINVT